ncbi:actin maturation protease isoform X2 [Bemisia tabaci]|uniref:actin maturation protease isoform X2 n=1 Tax=Bemisia tabaci TaxID=7038 RepID=UPI003B27BA2D
MDAVLALKVVQSSSSESLYSHSIVMKSIRIPLSPPLPPPPSSPLVLSAAAPSFPVSSEAAIVADWSNSNKEHASFSALWQSAGYHLTLEVPELHNFTFIQGYQQIGPTCGLVAVYMVAKHLNVDIGSKRIFELAIEKKMTKFGEMFCAKRLSQLAQEVFGSQAEAILHTGELQKRVPEALFQNHLILIPYDTDRNNEPCLKQGRKSHWAILCGIIQTKNNMFVIARQSKSRLLGIWSLEKLVASNANLSITDDKLQSGSVIPVEGLTQSLAHQCIIVKKK